MEHLVPNARLAPSLEVPVAGLVGRVTRGQVQPWSTCAAHPEDAVEHRPQILSGAPPRVVLGKQTAKRFFHPFPLVVPAVHGSFPPNSQRRAWRSNPPALNISNTRCAWRTTPQLFLRYALVKNKVTNTKLTPIVDKSEWRYPSASQCPRNTSVTLYDHQGRV